MRKLMRKLEGAAILVLLWKCEKLEAESQLRSRLCKGRKALVFIDEDD